MKYKAKRLAFQNVSFFLIQINKNKIIENINLHNQFKNSQHKLIFIDKLK